MTKQSGLLLPIELFISPLAAIPVETVLDPRGRMPGIFTVVLTSGISLACVSSI